MPTQASTCPITSNLCDAGCAWALEGGCAVAVLARALGEPTDDGTDPTALMAATSREQARPCGRYRELSAEVFD